VKGSSTPIGAFVVGFAFAFGWTPCLGPILTIILGFASQEDTLAKGIGLLTVYSLGLAVPFLLTSLLMERFLKFYTRFRSHMHALEVASGVLMIALGILLVTGRFTLISTWLSFLGRFEIGLENVVTKGPVAVVILAALVALALYLVFRRRPEKSESEPNTAATNRNPLALVVAAIVVAGMLYFGFHIARRTRTAPGSASRPAVVEAKDAPDFTLESLDGKNVRLSDLRGKTVLLNFWATWCIPCKVEMPWFVELQNEYGPQGLQIVGVAMDDSSKEDIAKFARDMGVNYPVLLGKEAVGDAYGGVPALPESFFISRDGRIVDKIMGLRGKADIEDSIKKALEARPSGQPAATADAVPVPK